MFVQVLEVVRVAVANRLADGGYSWTKIFSRYNSGTYNNQWMIVDLKRFIPGQVYILCCTNAFNINLNIGNLSLNLLSTYKIKWWLFSFWLRKLKQINWTNVPINKEQLLKSLGCMLILPFGYVGILRFHFKIIQSSEMFSLIY